MSWSNGLRVKNVVKLHTPDVFWSTRVFVMEFCCQFQSGDFIARVEHWSWSSSVVIIPFHIVLSLADRGFCLFDCCSHSLHEFIDRLQTGGVLLGFKAHARKFSSVEQEWRVLSDGVDVIVMLELRQG